jgi:hypothetical protein
MDEKNSSPEFQVKWIENVVEVTNTTMNKNTAK